MDKDEHRFIESQKRGHITHKRDRPGKSCCKCVLQETMKGADKAIVAKSFGIWKSSSQRSRTMEKPDEPPEESKEENLCSCTCESPRKGKEPTTYGGKVPHFLISNSHMTYFSQLIFLVAI